MMYLQAKKDGTGEIYTVLAIDLWATAHTGRPEVASQRPVISPLGHFSCHSTVVTRAGTLKPDLSSYSSYVTCKLCAFE